MQKEFIDYYDRRHCDIVSVVKDPKDEKNVRFSIGHEEGEYISPIEIYKSKARLNHHRDQQESDVNYYEIYSPVVN